MSDVSTRCLDTFPEWLRALAADASELAKLLGSEAVSEGARRNVAGGLNYLFKSLDLIPDGIEDLGFLDDAFVLRVAAAIAVAGSPEVRQVAPVLARLANESALVSEFLGADYARLESYVKGLSKGAARGRTVDEIISQPHVRSSFVSEVESWAASYDVPTFSRDEKNLVKMKSFLSTKLPAA